jgi:hypothetical protein
MFEIRAGQTAKSGLCLVMPKHGAGTIQRYAQVGNPIFIALSGEGFEIGGVGIFRLAYALGRWRRTLGETLE